MKRKLVFTLALLLLAALGIRAQDAQQPAASYGTIPPSPTIPTYTLAAAYPIAKTLLDQNIALMGTANLSLTMPAGLWIYLIDGTTKIGVDKRFSTAVSSISGKYVKLYGTFTYNALKKLVFAATAVAVYDTPPVQQALPQR